MQPHQSVKNQRLWELDALRGVAIILMVLFHLVFDLTVFFDFDISYRTGFWYYEGRVSAILFILLAGIASSLIHQRYSPTEALQKNSRRGLKLLGIGMLITLVTFLFFRDRTIWFGILHFLGLSILITMPLHRHKWTNLILAGMIFLTYFGISNVRPSSYVGLIFGFIPYGFSSFDYYALIPWLGYFLIGITLAKGIYDGGKPIIQREPFLPEKVLMALGKYSLWIYLLHQPIIIGFLWILFGV